MCGREARDGRVQTRTCFARFELAMWIALDRHICEHSALLIEVAGAAHGLTAQVIEAEVLHHAVEPREELSVLGKRIEVAVRAQKRLLAKVARILFVANNPERHRKCAALMTLHKDPERVNVARFGCRNQRPIIDEAFHVCPPEPGSLQTGRQSKMLIKSICKEV